MADIRQLLQQLTVQETQLNHTQFIAPCVQGGRVRTRVKGMVYTFRPQPQNFEGWGIFQPKNDKIATVVDEPSLPQLAEYWQLLQPFRLQLAYKLRGQTWLAYPVNESDAKQRVGMVRPVPVHLVTEGAIFEFIIARWDGHSWWFEEIDRRANPQVIDSLKQALKQEVLSESIHFKGMTPEMRTVYDLLFQKQENPTKQKQRKQEQKLRTALGMAGGQLHDFQDREDYWLVEWMTSTGERHSSAIAKNDLTVLSAGICLSGEDRKFDLQSLVGVVEAR